MSNIVSPFQMKRNKVVSFSIEQNEISQEYEATNVSLRADYKISDITKNASALSARVDLFITLTGITDNEEKIFEINLDMMGLFDGESPQIEEHKFEDMLKINGISTLMQLSRAYITSTTALAGFANPINFPMVNVFELIKMKEEMNKK